MSNDTTTTTTPSRTWDIELGEVTTMRAPGAALRAFLDQQEGSYRPTRLSTPDADDARST